MKQNYVNVEIILGVEELEKKLQQIHEKKTELWALINEAQEIAFNHNLRITFK